MKRDEHTGVFSLGPKPSFPTVKRLPLFLHHIIGDAQLVQTLLAVEHHLPVELLFFETVIVSSHLSAAMAGVQRHWATGCQSRCRSSEKHQCRSQRKGSQKELLYFLH